MHPILLLAAALVPHSAAVTPPADGGFRGYDDCAGIFKNAQFPAFQANILSQIDPDSPGDFGEAADDFVGDGEDLIGVAWFGFYGNDAPPPYPIEKFVITIYQTDPDGTRLRVMIGLAKILRSLFYQPLTSVLLLKRAHGNSLFMALLNLRMYLASARKKKF